MNKGSVEISCKDVEDFLQPYLEDRLKYRNTKMLLEHLKECHECMDELEIRYLLHEGLIRMESGHNLNLKKELERRLFNSGQHVLMIERLKAGVVMLLIALGIFAVVQIILMIV